ncbi:MAG: cell division protein FtsL [Pseudomonadota bacterium]
MRALLVMSLGAIVIALAVWAYAENYRTQASIDRVERLHRDIAAAQARMAVLKAEWAYLNRPDRLLDLAELNFLTLELLPLAPEQFGMIEQIPYPRPERLLVTDPIELMAPSETGEGEYP